MVNKITNEEKDRVLCTVAESKNHYKDVDMEMSDDREIIQHLVDLGVLHNDDNMVSGDESRITLTEKGAELYAKEGVKEKRSKGTIEEIWQSV